MKNNQLNRVLNLVRHTGDRVVVVDESSNDVLVVMNLSDYESLLKPEPAAMDYTENDFFSDPLESQTLQFDDELVSGPRSVPKNSSKNNIQTTSPRGNIMKRDVNNYKEERNNDEEWFYKGFKNSPHPEETLEDVPEEEEERFYLEPVDES